MKKTLMIALVLGAAASAGCNKVSQDQFDASMAQMQAELDEQRAGIQANAEAISAMQAELDAMQAELEELAEEYHAAVERYEDHIMFATPVRFDYDSSELRAADAEFLDRFAMVVSHHYPNAIVTVEGFADPAGPEEYNQRLSSKRAENVAAYLVERGGMASGTVRAVGYGESRLVAPGQWGDSSGGAQNRRVTFVVESVAG